jgi:sugar lactone lactonase YvrE
MQTIRHLTHLVRFPAMVLALLALTCGTPSRAWSGSQKLWIANDDGYGIESFSSKQLKKSGTPTPLQLLTYPEVTGLAFDKSHNLWVVIPPDEVVQFTAAQLKNLKNEQSPTPGVTITSTTFVYVYGCNFDHQGNLWLADYSNGSIDELSKTQLAAGSGAVTPAVVVKFSHPNGPNFVTFDKAGNAWVDGENDDTVGAFSPSQLTSGGDQSATVMLADDGSGTSLSAPGEIAFDKKGNLWVPNYSSATVVKYAKNQLSGISDPAPAVKLSSAIFDGPWGAAFDSQGDLVILNYTDATIAKFAPQHLKTSGAPVPKVSVTDGLYGYQIIFGPSS